MLWVEKPPYPARPEEWRSSSSPSVELEPSKPHSRSLFLLSMARLHHRLSSALASQCLLRPSPLPLSARLTLPFHSQPRPPPHPHGRSVPSFLAAASRYYASYISRRRRSWSARPMLARRRRARRKAPGELSVQIGIEEALPHDPVILVMTSARYFRSLDLLNYQLVSNCEWLCRVLQKHFERMLGRQ